MTCARESPCQRNLVKWALILLDNYEPRAWWSPTTSLPWQTSPCFFLCFGLRYINWHRLGFRYGYNFVMKDLWQPHLIDILANVLEILVFIFSPWSNFGNPNKTFFPFFLFNVSFYLWCFHIYCVDNDNFCISCGITFDLSSNQKLQLNLKTMDIRCEVKT
jgi:hypothetical protein